MYMKQGVINWKREWLLRYINSLRKQVMCAIDQPLRNEGQSTGPVRMKALLPVLDLLSVTFQDMFLWL